MFNINIDLAFRQSLSVRGCYQELGKNSVFSYTPKNSSINLFSYHNDILKVLSKNNWPQPYLWASQWYTLFWLCDGCLTEILLANTSSSTNMWYCCITNFYLNTSFTHNVILYQNVFGTCEKYLSYKIVPKYDVFT